MVREGAECAFLDHRGTLGRSEAALHALLSLSSKLLSKGELIGHPHRRVRGRARWAAMACRMLQALMVGRSPVREFRCQKAREAMPRIFVRRGCVDTYERLQEMFADDPDVQVLWDRRQGEPCAAWRSRQHPRTTPGDTEPQHEDRRRPYPATWLALDFIATTDSSDSPKSR